MTLGLKHFLLPTLLLLTFSRLAFAQDQSPQSPAKSAAAQPAVQSAGGGPAGASNFRVVRSIAGAGGEKQNGIFFVRDSRTVFHIPQDHTVFVYFEWEGPLGLHHFEGVWKGPGGKTISVSDFDYQATERHFARHWDMALSEHTPIGPWSFEAYVDGELTGTQNFQVIAGTGGGSADVPAQPALAAVPPATLYERALASTVSIENRSAQGQILNNGLGFFIAKGLVVTAFQVIDGASTLRVATLGGKAVEVKDVAAWNRRQDWAVLAVPNLEAPPIAAASSSSAVVGDRCYFLEVSAPGSQIIVTTSITGKNTIPDAGTRMNLATGSSNAGMGGALLDEYGELIGLTGGTLVPGASTLEAVRSGVPATMLLPSGIAGSAMATPIGEVLLPAVTAKTTTLEELAQTGQFIPPVVHRDDILYGTMTKDVRRAKEGARGTVQENSDFSRTGGSAAVFLNFVSRQKLKDTATVAVYDLDNKLVEQSPPVKLAAQAGGVLYLSQPLNIADLRPGVYRTDVIMDGNPVWRAFFKFTD
ncbi:MAG: serine protease [Candidatus Acidiferrales bacterium]